MRHRTDLYRPSKFRIKRTVISGKTIWWIRGNNLVQENWRHKLVRFLEKVAKPKW